MATTSKTMTKHRPRSRKRERQEIELRWDAVQFCEFIQALKPGNRDSTAVLAAINDLKERMETLMATQEERLQVILERVNEAMALLQDLRSNNPDLEDEIVAIETALGGEQPPTE